MSVVSLLIFGKMLSYSLFAVVIRSVRVVTVSCDVQFPLSFHVEAKSASTIPRGSFLLSHPEVPTAP